MRQPNVIFTINKKTDLDVALAFRTIKAGGVDFRKWGLLSPHPYLKKRERLTRKFLTAYIDRFYREHKKDLERACLDFARSWRKVSKIFFALVSTLFGPGFPSPGMYRCYPSMWNCNPRDIYHRSFQVFYRNKHPIEMMTHEMLHFAFYEYVYRRYPHLKQAKLAQGLWELSEAFNTVVLNSPKWRKQLGIRRQQPYPELRGLVQTMRRRWARSRSLDGLFDEFMTKNKKVGATACSRVIGRSGRYQSRKTSSRRTRTGSSSAAAVAR